MNPRLRMVLMSLLGAGIFVIFGFSGDEAKAQCCAPPPPCCQPPAPPPCCNPPTPPTPPQTPCCMPPGHNIRVPGVNVNVNASVVVQATVNAQVQANANVQAQGRTQGMLFFSGGGGGGARVGPGGGGAVQLNTVGMAPKIKRTAYEATREKRLKVVIRAFCLDDRDIPHPASQLFPEELVEDGYDGELFRCMAGTRMQYYWAEYEGRTDVDGGKAVICQKNDSLWAGREGKVECRPQKPARDCNERSLLRRFGAGVKVIVIVITETYTAYREEVVEEQMAVSSTMTLDGGVGGFVY